MVGTSEFTDSAVKQRVIDVLKVTDVLLVKHRTLLLRQCAAADDHHGTALLRKKGV